MSSIKRFSLIVSLFILCFCLQAHEKAVQSWESELSSIQVNPGATLQFSYIICHASDISTGSSNRISRSLKQSNNTSLEVVVTAMDIKRSPEALVHPVQIVKKSGSEHAFKRCSINS